MTKVSIKIAKRKKYNLSYNHNQRFGGIREDVLKRDSYKCVICGMSRRIHKKNFGRDITIDHKDNQGRNSTTKNHIASNLQTLCLSCHAKENVKYRVYRKLENHPQAKLKNTQVIEIKKLCKEGKLLFSEIAKIYKVDPSTVSKISKKLIWRHL